ncbi:YtxH domain-containing protein [Paenibacillus sp. HB172176]|uniref:YtxH domain-containing protein n=1 Tax=Paenibacillus sp. HB172176 TaxID=2493690 RepID=UPI00143BF66F|nr:YtxH domain-containing protein [Paenibacillus sp. HB172176]
MAKQTNGNGMVLGAVIGGIVGAAAALLLAPKSGKQMREDLGGQIQNISHKTKDIASNIRSQTKDIASNLTTQTKELASNLRSQAKETMEEACDKAEDAVNSMAPDEKDMKHLGKEMDVMPTNAELKEKGLVSDPAQ